MPNLGWGKVKNGNVNELRGHATLAELRRRMFAGDAPAPCQRCPQLQPFNRRHIIKSGLVELRNLLFHP